jgi:hypothetical protein
MSEILDGDEWKHAQPEPEPAAGAVTVMHLQQRTRAEQQAWLDEQYLRRKITLRDWRFHFDTLSAMRADGSFPPPSIP